MKPELEIIKRELKKELNSEKIISSPIEKGVMSKVFNLTVNNTEYILRYDTAEHSRYPLEAWTMDKVRKLGVPTPKAVVLGSKEYEKGKKVNYVVQEKLKGKALSNDFPKT